MDKLNLSALFEAVPVTSETMPPEGENVLCSWDGGNTFPEECCVMEKRTCMLAGIAGGNGYFGKGFATNGSTGCEKGLILDTPTHWLRPVTRESIEAFMGEFGEKVWDISAAYHSNIDEEIPDKQTAITELINKTLGQ